MVTSPAEKPHPDWSSIARRKDGDRQAERRLLPQCSQDTRRLEPVGEDVDVSERVQEDKRMDLEVTG